MLSYRCLSYNSVKIKEDMKVCYLISFAALDPKQQRTQLLRWIINNNLSASFKSLFDIQSSLSANIVFYLFCVFRMSLRVYKIYLSMTETWKRTFVKPFRYFYAVFNVLKKGYSITDFSRTIKEFSLAILKAC